MADLSQAYHEKDIKVPRYPRTGRPVSEMSFAGNNCHTGNKYLPIIRYEDLWYGKNLENDQEYCGTFYYYEPDSTNFLNLGRCLITANKLDAVIQLERLKYGFLQPIEYKDNIAIIAHGQEGTEIFNSGTVPAFYALTNELFSKLNHEPRYLPLDEDYVSGFTSEFLFNYPNRNELYDYIVELNNVIQNNRVRYRRDKVQSVITFEGLSDLMHNKIIPLWTTIISSEADVNDPKYIIDVSPHEEPEESEESDEPEESSKPLTTIINTLFEDVNTGEYSPIFVSAVDFTDQYICSQARELGYDTVLLQREIGETRVVTEILDVRSRDESYQNICKEKFNLPTHKTRYPAIWFPEYGFMTYTMNI